MADEFGEKWVIRDYGGRRIVLVARCTDRGHRRWRCDASVLSAGTDDRYDQLHQDAVTNFRSAEDALSAGLRVAVLWVDFH